MRPASGDERQILRSRLEQPIGRRGRQVAAFEARRVAKEEARDVERDVARAQDDGTAAEVWKDLRLRIVVERPRNGVAGKDPGKIGGGNIKAAVRFRAGREEDRIIAGAEVVQRHVGAEGRAPDEAGAAPGEHARELARDGLGAVAVGRDAVADETERRRRPIDHVDRGSARGSRERLRGVALRWPRPDDGDPATHRGAAQAIGASVRSA